MACLSAHALHCCNLSAPCSVLSLLPSGAYVCFWRRCCGQEGHGCHRLRSRGLFCERAAVKQVFRCFSQMKRTQTLASPFPRLFTQDTWLNTTEINASSGRIFEAALCCVWTKLRLQRHPTVPYAQDSRAPFLPRITHICI